MGQQVVDEQDRIARVFTDGDVDAAAIGFIDDANQGQGQADPLIFQQAAIVMGLEVDDFIFFDDRHSLDVQPRAVDMGADDFQPFFDGVGADDG